MTVEAYVSETTFWLWIISGMFIIIIFLGLMKDKLLPFLSTLFLTTFFVNLIDFAINQTERKFLFLIAFFALSIITLIRTHEWIIKTNINPK